MKIVTKLWGENGKFIAKALYFMTLAVVCLACGFVFSSILPVFVVLGFCFIVPAYWFCFKYVRQNHKEAEELE